MRMKMKKNNQIQMNQIKNLIKVVQLEVQESLIYIYKQENVKNNIKNVFFNI